MRHVPVVPAVFGVALAALALAGPAQANFPCVTCQPMTVTYNITAPRYDVTNMVIFGETYDGGIIGAGTTGPLPASASWSPMRLGFGGLGPPPRARRRAVHA